MKTKKHLTLLILLCFSGIVQVYAQLSWARSFDINTAIPGATWTDISNVLKIDQNRYIVAGTVTGTGAQSCVVARFSQDGVPGWVRELKGVPGSAITVNDITESKNAATPGYVICGKYEQGGNEYNYLARIDDMGNLQWDHYWEADAQLVAVIFTAANDIVTTGYARTTLNAIGITTYRFDNAGNPLASKIIDTDPEMKPVDILEDPSFTATGGFFILANFRNPSSPANTEAYCVFIDNTLNFVQSHTLLYPIAPAYYTNTVAVRFEQDINTRDLYILTNVSGSGRNFRPSVIRYTPVAGGSISSVVVSPAAASMPFTEPLEGTDINLFNGDATRGIMITTMHQAAGSIKTYTWGISSTLNTTSTYEQWLAVPNVRNTSLCLSVDAQHYVLAGHDAGNNLTLNEVNLNGDKVNNAGASLCVTPNTWFDEHPKIQPNPLAYSSKNISVNPTSVTTIDPRSWSYNNACWCAEERPQAYYRNAYPQIAYDNWELDINRATRTPLGDLYIANTMDQVPFDKVFFIELNATGQQLNTYTNYGIDDRDGRQCLQSATNGELIAAYRTLLGGAPRTYISRFAPGGSPTFWTAQFPTAQTPGRLFIAEALTPNRDIIAVADIDGPDETSNTHDLMIARLTSGGTTIYYQEIPITFNGMQRDNFRVLALEPTRDGGFAICGSSGYQNSDFIAGYVMRFSAAGVLMWQYEFRRQTTNPNSCYMLNGPQDCRSASMLFDLRHTGPNGFYIAGYTSDHDQNGMGASFWNGLVIHLSNTGVELAVQEYNDLNGKFTSFKGITGTVNEIAVVGDQTDPGQSMRNDLFVEIDKTTLGVLGAQTYSHDGNSSLLDVFNSGGGYVMSGSTTDWYGIRTPQVISTDYNGSNGCETAVDMGSATPVNDPVSLDLNTPVDYLPTPLYDEFGTTCVEVFDICEPLISAAIKPAHTGLGDFVNSNKSKALSEITVYPNPATSVLNLDVPKDVSVRALSIVDINGKEVYRSNASSMNNHVEINISALPEGMYAVRMETSAGKRYTRFIKL
jgi:hypothetical protein